MGTWVESLEEQAALVLPEPIHRYVRQGARDGVSTAEAVRAWDAYRLLPRVLRDVRAVRTDTSLLGTPVRTPFAIAPTTLQRAAHPDGELAMARGVAEAGGLLVVSSNAGSTFADIAATGVSWWLQAYVTADRSRTMPVLDRAVEAGARAIVLTVDTPVVGTKYDGDGGSVWDLVEPGWLRVNFPDPDLGDAEKAADLGPEDVAWLTERTGLPVVLKGVLRPDDAELGVQAGASAIWVSNHGGRQLDHAAPTAARLAAVAEAVGTDVEVYVDGGLRCGRHALVAGALGARGVFLGRPALYALAAGGAPGVRRLLDELTEELVEALRLAGCASWDAGGGMDSGLLSGADSPSSDRAAAPNGL